MMLRPDRRLFQLNSKSRDHFPCRRNQSRFRELGKGGHIMRADHSSIKKALHHPNGQRWGMYPRFQNVLKAYQWRQDILVVRAEDIFIRHPLCLQYIEIPRRTGDEVLISSADLQGMLSDQLTSSKVHTLIFRLSIIIQSCLLAKFRSRYGKDDRCRRLTRDMVMSSPPYARVILSSVSVTVQ